MKAHIKKVHERKNPHECKNCNATFRKPDALTKHMKVVHNSKILKCSNCDGSFKKVEDMVKHIETMHK